MTVTIAVLQLLFPLVQHFCVDAFTFLQTSEVQPAAAVSCSLLVGVVVGGHGRVRFTVRCCAFLGQVQPYFALPWILTWFSHSLQDIDTVSRLFDLFLVSHPLLPLYMAGAVSTPRGRSLRAVLALSFTGARCGNTPCMVHLALLMAGRD